MNYYLFRHAETENSKYLLPYPEGGGKNIEILPSSISVIQRLSEYLSAKHINAFYTSPFKRCLQTAEIVEKTIKIKALVDDRLGEELVSHNQETFGQLKTRITRFLEDLKSQNYTAVAICSHGWPLACLIALITKGDVNEKDFKDYPRPGVLACLENQKLKEIDFRTGKPKAEVPKY